MAFSPKDLLVLHAIACAGMTGVILVSQFAVYPQFGRIAETSFAAYHRAYTRGMAWVVAPLFGLETLTAIVLTFLEPSNLWVWANLGLVGLLWASTGGIQVPCHRLLSRGFDAAVHRRLVATNWVRTVIWVTRSLALGGILLSLKP
jgi:hypothetical protein